MPLEVFNTTSPGTESPFQLFLIIRITIPAPCVPITQITIPTPNIPIIQINYPAPCVPILQIIMSAPCVPIHRITISDPYVLFIQINMLTPCVPIIRINLLFQLLLSHIHHLNLVSIHTSVQKVMYAADSKEFSSVAGYSRVFFCNSELNEKV